MIETEREHVKRNGPGRRENDGQCQLHPYIMQTCAERAAEAAKKFDDILDHLEQKADEKDLEEVKKELSKKANTSIISILIIISMALMGIIWDSLSKSTATLHNRISVNATERREVDTKILETINRIERDLSTALNNKR